MLVLSPRAGRHNIAEALQFRRLLLEGGGREAALLCAPGVPLSISRPWYIRKADTNPSGEVVHCGSELTEELLCCARRLKLEGKVRDELVKESRG